MEKLKELAYNISVEIQSHFFEIDDLYLQKYMSDIFYSCCLFLEFLDRKKGV